MITNEQLQIIERISPVILVMNSSGRIETNQVVKENNRYKNITNYLEYTLKKSTSSIIDSLIEEIQELDSQLSTFRWYKLNFIERILFNKKKRLFKVLETIKEDCSWIIVPDSFFYLVSKLNQDDSNQIVIIPDSNKDSNKIVFGKYDSFEMILNSNTLEYQIVQKNKIKVLELI